MNGHRRCRLITTVLSLLSVVVISPHAFGHDTRFVRVMSFNIRFGSASDGQNQWDRRKEFLLETIQEFDPDLLGTQETLGFQRDFLARGLADYEVLGVGRDDGGDAGEMMAVFYRKDRFEQLDAGHFWLSETPEKPGSKSWDSSLPRMATWVKLRDRRQPDARPILFLNTHFDHRGWEARRQSARLIRSQLRTLGENCSLIVTGDFNAGEASPPYGELFDLQDGTESPVMDAFRRANPDRRPDEGTFSGFMPMVRGGPRIDWIATSRDWIVLDSKILHTAREGRTPSDHFPVTALLSRVGP